MKAATHILRISDVRKLGLRDAETDPRIADIPSEIAIVDTHFDLLIIVVMFAAKEPDT